MNGPLLAYYADDFTGATDILNVLAGFGVRSSLFLRPPEPSEVDPDTQAVGIAGLSRSMTNTDLRYEVTSALRTLHRLNPAVLQYKVCSTFDSAADLGNIGVALDCGREVTGERTVPVIVGMPQLGRYVLFGNLFAAAGATVHRLDRHPTMATHPRTPMTEADLRRHLHDIAGLRAEGVDITSLRAGGQLDSDADAVVYDTLTTDDLVLAGRAVLATSDGPRFIVGSSGASWAVLAGAGMRDGAQPPGLPPGPAQTLMVSGSCSPVTANQLDLAVAHGFARLSVDVTSPTSWQAVERDAIAAARTGRSIVVSTADTPNQRPAVPISSGLARIARSVLDAHPIRRLMICGGDTSGEVATALGVTSIEYAWALDPGAPFTTVTSDDSLIDGLSVIFKGGQMGRPDIATAAQAGGRASDTVKTAASHPRT